MKTIVTEEHAHEPPKRDEHSGDGVARGTARMEAFADAVFAIALTLPVVHIKLPEASPNYGADLLALWPGYLAYALSVLVIGIYWVQHHFSGAIYRTTGHLFILATVLFLSAIGFIAFPTYAFAEHIADPETRIGGARFYVTMLAFTALTWWIKWRTGRAMGQVDARLDGSYVRRLSRSYDLTTLLMLVAAGLVWVRWEAGLALAGLVTLSFLRAPETPVYTREAPSVEGEGGVEE